MLEKTPQDQAWVGDGGEYVLMSGRSITNHGLDDVLGQLAAGGNVVKLNLENNNLTEEGARKLIEYLLPPVPMGADACLQTARNEARAVAGYLRGAQLASMTEALDVFEQVLACSTEADVRELLDATASGAHVGGSLFTAKYGTSSKDREEFIAKVVAITDRPAAAELYNSLHLHAVSEKRRILASAFSTTHPLTDTLRAQALSDILRQSYTFEYILYCLSFFHKTHAIGDDIRRTLASRLAASHDAGAAGGARDSAWGCDLDEELRITYIGKLLASVTAQATAQKPGQPAMPSAKKGRPTPGDAGGVGGGAGGGSDAPPAQLQLLRLGGNPLGDLGALHVSTLLKFDTVLTKLYLNKCCIGDEGAEHIADALRTCNTTLTFVDLTLNAITDVGGVALVEIFGKNRALTTLRVDGNMITQEVEAILVRATDGNRAAAGAGGSKSGGVTARLAAAMRGALQVEATPNAAGLTPYGAAPAAHILRNSGGPTPPRDAAAEAAAAAQQVPPSTHVEDMLFKVRTLLLMGKANRALNVVEDLLHDSLACPRGAERCRSRTKRAPRSRHAAHKHARRKRPATLDLFAPAGTSGSIGGGASGSAGDEYRYFAGGGGDSDAASTPDDSDVVDTLATGGLGAVSGGAPYQQPPDDDRYLKQLLKKVAAMSQSPERRRRSTKQAGGASAERERPPTGKGARCKIKETGLSATYTPYYQAPETDLHHFVNEWSAERFEPWKSRRYQLFHDAEEAWRVSDWRSRDTYVRRGRDATKERNDLARKLGLNPSMHRPEKPTSPQRSPSRSVSPQSTRSPSRPAPRGGVSSGDEGAAGSAPRGKLYSFDLGGVGDAYVPFYDAPQSDYHFFMNAKGEEQFVAGKTRKYVLFYEVDQAWRSSNWATRTEYITRGKEAAGVFRKAPAADDSDGGDPAGQDLRATAGTHVSSVGDDPSVRAAMLSQSLATDAESAAQVSPPDGSDGTLVLRVGSTPSGTLVRQASDAALQSTGSFRRLRFLKERNASAQLDGSLVPSSPATPRSDATPATSALASSSKKGRTLKKAVAGAARRAKERLEGERVVIGDGCVLWTVRSETAKITFVKDAAHTIPIPAGCAAPSPKALGTGDVKTTPRGRPPPSPAASGANLQVSTPSALKSPLSPGNASVASSFRGNLNLPPSTLDPPPPGSDVDSDDLTHTVHKLAPPPPSKVLRYSVQIELNGRVLGDVPNVAVPFEPSRRTYLQGDYVTIEDHTIPLPQQPMLRGTILRELFTPGFVAAAAEQRPARCLVPADLATEDQSFEFVSSGHVVQFWIASKVSMRYSINGRRRPAFRRLDFNGVNVLSFNGRRDPSIAMPVVGMLAILQRLRDMAQASGVQHNIPDEVDGYSELLVRELARYAERGEREKGLALLNERLSVEEENDKAAAGGLLAQATPPLPQTLAGQIPQAARPPPETARGLAGAGDAGPALPGCIPWKYSQPFSFLAGSSMVGFFEVNRRMPDYITQELRCLLVDETTFYLYTPNAQLDYSLRVSGIAALLVGQDQHTQLHLVIHPAGDGEGLRLHDVMVTGVKADVMKIVKLLKTVAAKAEAKLAVKALAMGGLEAQVNLQPAEGMTPMYTRLTPSQGMSPLPADRADGDRLMGSSRGTRASCSTQGHEPAAASAEDAPSPSSIPAAPAEAGASAGREQAGKPAAAASAPAMPVPAPPEQPCDDTRSSATSVQGEEAPLTPRTNSDSYSEGE